MRSFIAIELPDAVKSALSEFQQVLMKCKADVKWVRPEAVHLTLKFLGNVSERDVGNIINSLEGTCKNYTAFHLEIAGVGVFPNKRVPRVLWVGITGNGTLAAFQQEIDDTMASMGFEKENRRFTPHLTLGRLRSMRGNESLSETVELYKKSKFGSLYVTTISFMKSDLTPSGAKYTRVAEISLAQ